MASPSKKVIYAALTGDALTAVTKFFASLATGSSAMPGLMVAMPGILLVQMTENPLYDGGIASVCIGIILGLTAIWLAYETKGLLTGVSAGREIEESMAELTGEIKKQFPDVKRIFVEAKGRLQESISFWTSQSKFETVQV